MLTFENKEYREGWLEGVIRTSHEDLQYLSRTLKELQTIIGINPEQAKTLISVMVSRSLVMSRCVEDAMRRIDELKAEQERQNALKRLAAIQRRGKAADILNEAFGSPLFLSHARVEDHADMDKEAGITPTS